MRNPARHGTFWNRNDRRDDVVFLKTERGVGGCLSRSLALDGS